MTKTILAAAFGPLTPLTHPSRCMFSSLGRMHIFIVGSMHNFVHGHIFRHNIMIITNSSVTFCKKKYHYYTGIFLLCKKIGVLEGLRPPLLHRFVYTLARGKQEDIFLQIETLSRLGRRTTSRTSRRIASRLGRRATSRTSRRITLRLGRRATSRTSRIITLRLGRRATSRTSRRITLRLGRRATSRS